MIQLFNSIDFSQFVIVTLIVLLLTSDLEFISMAKDFCWCRVERLHSLFEPHQDYDEADFDDYDGRPSPSQVPVPFMAPVVSKLIKTKLPVVEFGRSKLGADIGEQSSLWAECAICLECVEGGEEIRELGNCSHLYHRACIDGWIDQGHETCPLCGRKLLPFEAIAIAPAAADEDKEVKGVYDPWRLERMAYLFGDNY
ncbi:Detected protein of unknown function [Hibiscus syriacus]|uniref:RING-type domain-containing protein n=1 Tax=Hibiscus syriacus TaxID=106335 RepID=A0A6A2X7A8_HIBSY|nr:RING-H2 finger protein ATL73-like [Hibiscus syriacus]KAE8671213.1 Detected protein of unknown function [Hibiscus syriacus]